MQSVRAIAGYITLLIFVLIPGFVSAKDFDAQVRVYEMEDWLSFKNGNYPSSLTSAFEYVYFGTNGGVIPYHRYGKYWEDAYTVSDGLADDFITAVLFDESTHILWVAHREGLSYLTQTAPQWENISIEDLLPVHARIERLGIDAQAIWVQASGGYLFRIHKITGTFQSFENQVSTGVVWSPSHLDLLPSFPNYFLDFGYQLQVEGLILDEEFREYPISLFYINSGDDIYGGAWGLGLLTGDAHSRRLSITPRGPLQNSVQALTLGANGIWMAGYDFAGESLSDQYGISEYRRNEDEWIYHEDILIPELATHEVTELRFSDSRLWAGTTQGISIYHTKRGSWKRIAMSKGLWDEVITSIAIGDSTAWIGTPRGLNRISIPKYRVKRIKLTTSGPSPGIRKLHPTQKRIWVGTDNGLYSIHRDDQAVEHFDIFGATVSVNESVASRIQAIGSDDSLVVAATFHELIGFDLKSEEFVDFPSFQFLPEVYVRDLDVDGKYAWLATDQGAYLIRLDDGYIEKYTMLDGLPSDSIYRVIIDNDYVWLGTNNGLTLYHWRRYAE